MVAQDSSMRSWKQLSIYLRAASALLIPLVAAHLWYTGRLSVVAQIAREQAVGRWLGLAVAILLVVLEWRFLVTLSRLGRAGGRVRTFAALNSDPTELARRRRVTFRLTTVAMSTLAAFCVAEAMFRILGIEPPPPPPAVAAEWEAFDKSVNALGIREEWDVLASNDPRLRIAFLGDSITFGDNVERHQTFCHLTEDLLAADWPEGVVTINVGYRGTAPGRQLRKYLALRDALRPDVVVHVVYPNDLGINMHHLLDEIYRIRDDDLWVGGTSYVLRLAEHRIRTWVAWNKTVEYFRGGGSAAQRVEAWATFKRDVRACMGAIEQDGAVYSLVLFPWLVRLDDYMLTDVHVTMREFAIELGVPYLDLLEVFLGQGAGTLRVSAANEHPNKAGHRVAADRLARFLREQVLPTLKR